MSRKSKTFGSLVKIVGILFGIWIVFSWIYSGLSSDKEDDSLAFEIIDDDILLELEAEGDIEVAEAPYSLGGEFFSNELAWKDNNQNEYEGVFKVHEEYFERSTQYRERIKSSASWTAVYGKLAVFDEGKLDELMVMYEEIKEEKGLNQKEFADMVVTSIQNIPYALVHSHTHDEADDLWGDFYKEYHESGEPCLENIKFGVQSPVEFMSNFLGDCDTRALLCYLVLKDFGFDVVMLGSDEYSHEVLGISGNYRGSFVKKDGIKYYAWETTAVGYRPGVMVPEWSDMDYWIVDISSKD